LLFAVCCLLFAVCCLLFAVCCLLFAVCCLLFVVCCLMSSRKLGLSFYRTTAVETEEMQVVVLGDGSSFGGERRERGEVKMESRGRGSKIGRRNMKVGSRIR
jgi:hypothetical protein